MRIISGSLKGRTFNPPADKWPTRPTTDYTREGLFNTLMNRMDFESVRVLDLYGGSGSISFEFLSRGCRDVTLIDHHNPCIQYVKKLSERWNLESSIQAVRADATTFLETVPSDSFHVIFADPPYNSGDVSTLISTIFDRQLLKLPGMFILEHDKREQFKKNEHFVENRSYGNTQVSFFYRREE